jgi:HEPN domain-containing protein
MDRKDLRSLSRVRFSEARALPKAGLPDGAYYLAGYAVECALKACIARETQRYEFPEKKRVDASYTHNLKELVRVAELRDELQATAMRIRCFDNTGLTYNHGRSRAAMPSIPGKAHRS